MDVSVAEPRKGRKKIADRSTWKREKSKVARHKPKSAPKMPTCQHGFKKWKICCSELTVQDMGRGLMMGYPMPSLKSLSLASISTHIWHSWNLSTALIEIDLVAVACVGHQNGKSSKDADIPYYSRVKPVYDAIMAMDLLESVKIQVAFAFIKLEANMLAWAKDMVTILKKPKLKENIAYCLAKTIVRVNLTIDRETTMFNVLFDSYGRVKLGDFGPGNICVLTVRNLYKFIENNSAESGYRRHGWLSRKIRRELRYYKPMKHWHTSMRFMSYVLKIKNTKMELLMLAMKDTNLEVFENLLYKLSNQYYVLSLPPRVYTQLLSHAMLGDFDDTTDLNIIIFLLDKLHDCDQRAWLTFLTYWFSDILVRIFCSSDAECSVMYFQKGCEIVTPNVCAHTVKRLLQVIKPNVVSSIKPYDEAAQNIKHRAVFFEIWSRTPYEAKKILFDSFTEKYLYICEDKDFYFLSVLLTDKAFTKDQRDFLLMAKVLEMENQDEVEALLSHLPEHNNRDFIKNASKETLRRYIIHSCKCCMLHGIKLIFETQAELYSFKKELLQDKDFVVDACVAMGYNFTENWASRCLLWFLDTDESVSKFVEDKLVSQQWIIDIVKKYLVTNSRFVKDSSLIDFFVKDAEARLRLKRIIRKDVPFMLEAIDKVFWSSPAAIKDFLTCIFDPEEKNEQKSLIEMYLCSEKGLRAIRSFVTYGEKVKNTSLYTKHRLKHCMISMKKFKTCWLKPFNLTPKVIELLSVMEVQSESPIVFPHQTEKEGEVIVSRNLRMFLLILHQDVKLDNLIHTFATFNAQRIAFDAELQDDLL